MRGRYSVASDRYNRIHAFVKSGRSEELYLFEPESEWMPINITKSPDGEIVMIDTDGGPNISVGWHNDEIEVMELFEDKEDGRIICRLKERI